MQFRNMQFQNLNPKYGITIFAKFSRKLTMKFR